MTKHFLMVFVFHWFAVSASLCSEEGKTPMEQGAVSGKTPVTVSADKLTKTIVTPYLNCPIGQGSNVLWCATFQLAWDHLCGAAGGPIQLEPKLKDCDILNKGQINTNDLDASSFVAMAGLGPQALDRIRKELQTRFADAARPTFLPSSVAENEWIAYAYLFQHLPFKSAFTRMEYGLTFDGREVASFGIAQYLLCQSNEVEMAKQVLLYDYRIIDGFDSFILELEPTNRTHRIILAHIPPPSNLNAAVSAVVSQINKATPTRLKEGDTLIIPVIDFDILKAYSKLHGRITAKDPKINGTSLGLALQSIRFRLDEAGAGLESEGIAAADGGKELIFQKPFLVLLQKRGAQNPYFALWVANADLLTPFVEPKKPGQPKKDSGQSKTTDPL